MKTAVEEQLSEWLEQDVVEFTPLAVPRPKAEERWTPTLLGFQACQQLLPADLLTTDRSQLHRTRLEALLNRGHFVGIHVHQAFKRILVSILTDAILFFNVYRLVFITQCTCSSGRCVTRSPVSVLCFLPILWLSHMWTTSALRVLAYYSIGNSLHCPTDRRMDSEHRKMQALPRRRALHRGTIREIGDPRRPRDPHEPPPKLESLPPPKTAGDLRTLFGLSICLQPLTTS